MARTAGKNGKSDNKAEATRAIVMANNDVSVPDLVADLKAKYKIDMDPKMATTYRYNARKALGLKIGKRRGRRRRGGAVAVIAATPVRAVKPIFSGMDELLVAGSKLGWGRVKELVDKITQAPDFRGN